MNINLTEIFKHVGMADIVAKSMCTRLCKKLKIENDYGLIGIKDLITVKEYYNKSNSPKYKDKILDFIESITNGGKISTLSEDFFLPNNLLLQYDPFEASHLLHSLVGYLRDTDNFDALAFYEEEYFKLKNFVSLPQ